MSARYASIGVVGAGAWGTALANASARAGREVVLWGRDRDLVAAMARTRSNPTHLPGVVLADTVRPTADLAVLAGMDAILLVVPAQASRPVAAELAPHLAAGTPVVTCAKGIERGTSLFMTQVLSEACPQAVPAILSGPSFAADVAAGLPTAVTLACRDLGLAEALAAALGSSSFRLYHSADVRGVEIGGAAKNVLAIACGVCAGMGLGASAQAALVARGFAELRRFARAWGGRDETLMGLSGLGDLVLTCGSMQSRNFALGHALGRGDPPPEKLAEGAFTASALVEMARARSVEMPIGEAVAAMLEGRLTASGAVTALLARPPKSEA